MTDYQREDLKQMAKCESVARKKSEEDLARDLAAELAKDTRVIKSVRVSMEEIAAGNTVSFEEAFGAPGPS